MKKIFIYIIFILISANISANAKNYKWKKIVTTIDDHTDFYLDINTIRNVGNFHYFWMMSDYLILEPKDDPNIRSTITHNILSCKKKEYKMITYTSFSGNRGRGAIDIDVVIPEFHIDFFVWKKIENGSTFEKISEVVCN